MISTHVTVAGRSAAREIGKAHGLDGGELSRLTRGIPHWGSTALADLPGRVPECRSLPAGEEPYRTILFGNAIVEALPPVLYILLLMLPERSVSQQDR